VHGEQNWTKASLTLARHHGTQVLLDLACQSDGKTRDIVRGMRGDAGQMK